MDNSTENQDYASQDVKERQEKALYKPNDILKRFIYVEHKSNLNRFAKELGTTRQYIYGIISGRLKPSIQMALRICETLKVKDSRLVFPENSIDTLKEKSQEIEHAKD